ncbi:MAG: MaoC family dehydratase N-terminal domain-containing protein [Aquamicrobium sp.]|nr:MaoC family dehydratase N-terminal domain-containing protein [Aquamicrobium sp.]
MSRYDDLMAFEFPNVEHTYRQRDTILYALGVGAGWDWRDPAELRFVYEKDLATLPSMAVTLAYPGFWYRDLDPGLDFTRVVHASERIEIHRPLPAAATVSAKPEIVAIHDRGEGRGSLIVSRRDILEAGSSEPVATVQQTAFCRGDGGLGGPMVPAPAPNPLPQRAPDHVAEVPVSPQAALIYRLSGDYNPLHVDPDFAAAAGFEHPILHGLSTYGHVCRQLVKARGADAFMRMMDCRFTAPVFPGDTLTTRIWFDGPVASFQAQVGARTVIDNGIAEFA